MTKETKLEKERKKIVPMFYKTWRCVQCNRIINPIDAMLHQVCLSCCRANHKAVVGKS